LDLCEGRWEEKEENNQKGLFFPDSV